MAFSSLCRHPKANNLRRFCRCCRGRFPSRELFFLLKFSERCIVLFHGNSSKPLLMFFNRFESGRKTKQKNSEFFRHKSFFFPLFLPLRTFISFFLSFFLHFSKVDYLTVVCKLGEPAVGSYARLPRTSPFSLAKGRLQEWSRDDADHTAGTKRRSDCRGRERERE